MLSYRRPDGLVVLPTPAGVRKRLWHLLQAIGITNVADYNTHSLRRSGACHLLAKGLPLDSVKVLGDWKSDTVFAYLTPDISTKFQMLHKGFT